jgi:hypothetical protein
METILGTSVWVFIGMTLILSGGAAFLMGNALAETWRPWWQNVAYGALLAVGTQFMTFALFHGAFIVESLVSSEGKPLAQAVISYLVNAAVLIAISLAAYRLTLSRKMVRQYPWLYERTGPFSWRTKS